MDSFHADDGREDQLNAHILEQGILAISLLLILRQRSDVFWLAPLFLSIFVGDKAQIVTTLLAESVLFFEIQQKRWPRFSKGHIGFASIGAFFLLCAGILPIHEEFRVPALLLYVFVRVMACPFGHKQDEEIHFQNYHLFLAAFVWATLGQKLSSPYEYIFGGLMAAVAIFGLLVGSPRQGAVALLVSVQLFFGTSGAMGALAVALLVSGPAAHALGSLFCSFLVLSIATSLFEPLNWVVGSLFMILLGYSRGRIPLPSWSEFNLRANARLSFRNIFSVLVIASGVYFFLVQERITPELYLLMVLIPLIEWLARKYRAKSPQLNFDRPKEAGRKLADRFAKGNMAAITELSPGGFELAYRPPIKLAGWMEREAIGFALAAIIVWSLWTWLF